MTIQVSFFFFIHSFCRDAAIVMLSGQVADAFATIFTGELVPFFSVSDLAFSYFFGIEQISKL